MTSSLETIRTLLVRDHDLPPERLGEDASLETLGIDSLGIMELLWNLEEDLGITLPTDRVELHTLGEVATYVDGLVAERRDEPTESTPENAPENAAASASTPHERG